MSCSTVDETENAELLPAVALGLGALGILVEVTLQCVPAFVLHAVERPEPLGEVLDALDERVAAADHFEFYWFPHTDRGDDQDATPACPRARRGIRCRPSASGSTTSLVGSGLHQVACSVGERCPRHRPADQPARPCRLWGDREFTDVSHARVRDAARRCASARWSTPCRPRTCGPRSRRCARSIDERGWRIAFPVEVRFAAADDLWLSTAHGRASGYIAVHRYWREDPTEYFEAVEQIMLAFGGRPHWGKMHTLDAAILRERYPRFDDFVALRDRLDPERMFQNRYLERVLGE